MNKPQRDITLRFLAEPQDVNFGGKVHGGAVMKWIDLAAYATAAGWSHTGLIAMRFAAPASCSDREQPRTNLSGSRRTRWRRVALSKLASCNTLASSPHHQATPTAQW